MWSQKMGHTPDQVLQVACLFTPVRWRTLPALPATLSWVFGDFKKIFKILKI